MKKVMVLLCMLLLLGQSAVCVSADSPTVVASDVTGMPGETVAVTVRLEGNPGLISAKVKVGYDAAALEFVEVEEGDFPAAWYSFGNPEKNPFVVTFCNGTAGGNYAAQLFATLRFKIREDAPAGTYPLTLTCDFEGDFFNTEWETVNFDIDEGSVTVVRSGNTTTTAKPTAGTTATPDAPTTGTTGDGTAAPAPSGTVTEPSPSATTVPTTVPQPETTHKQEQPATPWVAVVIPLAAVVVIAAGLTLFVLLRKKKKK